MNLQNIFGLKNRVALVTGSCGGLGQVLVKILLEAEAKVILVDLDEKKLLQFAKTVDPNENQTLICTADITQLKEIDNIINKAHEKFNRIDILVNCAGILGPDNLMDDVTESDWDKVMDVNLKGTWLMASTISRYMIQQKIHGNIINISSSLGYRTQLKRIAYATSKAGVEHLTRLLAIELVNHQIRVNCLAPGWMETEMVKNILEGPEGNKWRALIPLQRAAKPEELAGALLLLASDASSYMTGAILRVDGGYTLHNE